MKVCVYTLGCKVNQYESGAIMASLTDKGYDVTTEIEPADIYIVNTCAVTNEAERKSRQIVHRIRKISTSAKIIVCGCSSQRDVKKFFDDENTLIYGTSKKSDIVKNLEKSGDLIAPLSSVYEDLEYSKFDRTRSFIKVQDGCDNFCSYCIVPYLRGRSRSRDINSIIDEVDKNKKLVKEFVITGINISDYGKHTENSLVDILKRLDSDDFRVRLGSLEVGIINEDFLKAAQDMSNFCPHFHLSLQSGSDAVLSKMNRKYTTAEYIKKVELIKKHFANCGLTTDIIVGFPTETEADNVTTQKFVEEVGFSDMHVFPYSRRQGTVAAELDVLPSGIVKKRVQDLTIIKRRLHEKFLKNNLFTEHEILIEQKIGNNLVGYTRNYIRAYIPQSDALNENSFAKLTMKELFEDGGKFV